MSAIQLLHYEKDTIGNWIEDVSDGRIPIAAYNSPGLAFHSITRSLCL